MKTVDLFSGCGGMSLGFGNAGFDVIAAFDKWLPAIKVYKDNFNHPIYDVDLSLDESKRLIQNSKRLIQNINAKLIIGGPPCQDFSSAGKRDESLGRADLTISYAQIISACKPEWFVMENVERITKSGILKQAISVFKKAGYGLTMKVLDASFCGVPQTRKRFFMIGHLFSKDNFLQPYLEKKLSNEPMTIFDYLGDTFGVNYYYRHPRSYQRRGVFSITEPSPTIRGVNRPIPKGYQKHPGDIVDIKECNVRALTTIERSYIQTFPKNFIFNGSKTDLEQVIGNAVPVKLAEFVAKRINEYVNDLKNDSVLKSNAYEGVLQMALNF